MNRETLIALLTLLATVFLIGIPTAAGYYPPLFAGLADSLPLDFILTWMLRFGILALGIFIGWFGRSILTDEPEKDGGSDESGISVDESESGSNSIETIEGCIEVGGALWRGTAHLSNGQLAEIEVPYKAYCPRCQTVMYDNEKEGVPVAVVGKTEYMDCPNCGYRTEKTISKYHDAEKLFDTHFQRIIESAEEKYSLQMILDNIDGEVTPRSVWKEYAEIVDDKQVSTNRFH